MTIDLVPFQYKQNKDNVYSSFRHSLMVWNTYIKSSGWIVQLTLMVNSNKSWSVTWLLAFENVKRHYKFYILSKRKMLSWWGPFIKLYKIFLVVYFYILSLFVKSHRFTWRLYHKCSGFKRKTTLIQLPTVTKKGAIYSSLGG